ncbi:MAG: DUF4126 domain-containing protein [bacterium]
MPRQENQMNAEVLLSIAVGIGLASACGFRVFVPLLVVSIASLSGHLILSPGFEWLGSFASLFAFGAATIFEIAGYYIPWFDHLLDIIATPAAVVAGTIVMASAVFGMSPLLHWSLAIIAGGGLAGLIQVFTGLTRLTSSATTGGLGNPLVSTVEAGGSITLSILAIVLPFVAAAIVLFVVTFAVRFLYKKIIQPT